MLKTEDTCLGKISANIKGTSKHTGFTTVMPCDEKLTCMYVLILHNMSVVLYVSENFIFFQEMQFLDYGILQI